MSRKAIKVARVLSKGYVRKVPVDEPPSTDLPQRDLGDDPLAMRALAHPLRLRLLEELTLRGPLTATQCADLVGESPSSCSFHLRTLAKYGFVEEAEGGTGRQRPWRTVALGNRWQSGPDTAPAVRTAGAALAAQVRRRDRELLDEHLAREAELPAEWLTASIHSNFGSWLTAEELAQLGEALEELWRPYLARLRDHDRRPDGSRLVHMFAHAFPRPEGASPADDGGAADHA
jgi:DNA-binding transcriptional ArsR family regulator